MDAAQHLNIRDTCGPQYPYLRSHRTTNSWGVGIGRAHSATCASNRSPSRRIKAGGLSAFSLKSAQAFLKPQSYPKFENTGFSYIRFRLDKTDISSPNAKV